MVRLGQSGLLRLIIAGLFLGVGLTCHLQQQARGEGYQSGTPFTYLFDTGTRASNPLPVETLAAKPGWTLLPEDRVEHDFRGDAVLLNDKLTVVLRAKGPGAEVYSQTAKGARHRAVLMSLPAAATSVEGLASVRILENNPGAVMVEVTSSTTGGGSCSASYRLTTGERTVQMRAGQSADELFVLCRARWVVVPDFFGDDMVFGPETLDRSRFGLPAENFLLNLIPGGDAMVICVWESSKQDAYAHLTSHRGRQVLGGCQFEGVKDKSLWVALLEGADLWHQRAISADDAKREIVLDWKPPFAAKWRADLVGPDGAAESRYFDSPGESGQAADIASEQGHRCWFDADRAVVQIHSEAKLDPARERYPRPLVIYPLDRSRATPLTVFCPVDVLRNTLGVGPCEYILQTEGLASETNPTPDNVMSWVENQFKKNKETESAEEIRELLDEMTDHVGHAQERIDKYADFARDISALCKAHRQKKDVSDAAEAISRIADEIERTVATGPGATATNGHQPKVGPSVPTERAAELADEIVGLIGKPLQEDALAECQRLGIELRRIGALQDRTLSKCRMKVRWLKQQARMIAASDPRSAELAEEIWARAERILEKR